MNKIKLIIGNSPSHLLEMAQTMAFRKNYQIIPGDTLRKDHPHAYSQCTRQTEVIIIQDLPVLHLYTTISVLSAGEIVINPRGETAYTHNVEVIITCRCKVEWLMVDPRFLNRVTLVESRVSSHPDVEPVQVPAFVAESIGREYFKDQVIVLSWDKGTSSVSLTTWGHTADDKLQAENIGTSLKVGSHWFRLELLKKLQKKWGTDINPELLGLDNRVELKD